MKKIFILLLLIATPLFGQVQTTNRMNNTALLLDRNSVLKLFNATMVVTNGALLNRYAYFNGSGLMVGVDLSAAAFTTSNNTFIAGTTLTNLGSTVLSNLTVNGISTANKAFYTKSIVVTNGPVGTMTNDWSLGNEFIVVLTNNVSIANPINIRPIGSAQPISYIFVQDATGSRTVTFSGSLFSFGTDITSYTATATANKKDYVGIRTFILGTTTQLNVVAVTKGF